MSSERIQKILARAGVASRRSSEKLIASGKVTVNGNVVIELGSKADPDADVICVDGEPIDAKPPQITLALNKPCGYITAMSDDHGSKCVSDLVPTDVYPSLFPVGRLDKDTSGLLIFTTDGELGNHLLHPRNHVGKRYRAAVDSPLSEQDLKTLKDGVQLEDGMTLPAQARFVGHGRTEVELTIFEGRNRQVRRMFDALGHPVVSLKRLAIGDVELGGLAVGEYRELLESEIAALSASSAR